MTKQQITNGIVRYMKETMAMQIPDTWTRRIVAGLADLMSMRPDTIDKIMQKYPILDMIKDEKDNYDIDIMADLLKRNINEYGSICLDIMGASFTFGINDINDLKEAMMR